MTWLETIVLAIIQGLCEFLPVSSSGHLAIAERLFGLNSLENMLLFDVMLHLGTLAAVVTAFWNDIKNMLSEFIKIFTDKLPGPIPPARRLVFLVIVATLPLTAVVFFSSAVDAAKNAPYFVGIMLLVTCLLLMISDRVSRGKKNESTARLRDVIIIGLSQVLAVFPGLSRSGTTISTGLLCGLDRQFAVRFSFLLSIPAVLGATLLEGRKLFSETSELPASFLQIAVGMLIAAIVGYIAIIMVRKLMKSGKFSYFAWYCLIAGSFSIIVDIVNNVKA